MKKIKFEFEIRVTWFEYGGYEVRSVGQFIGLGDAEICCKALQQKAEETGKKIEYSIHRI